MKFVVQNTATKLSSDFIITYKGGDIGELPPDATLFVAFRDFVCVYLRLMSLVLRLLLISEQTFAPPIEPAFMRLRGLWLAHLRGKFAGEPLAPRV